MFSLVGRHKKVCANTPEHFKSNQKSVNGTFKGYIGISSNKTMVLIIYPSSHHREARVTRPNTCMHTHRLIVIFRKLSTLYVNLRWSQIFALRAPQQIFFFKGEHQFIDIKIFENLPWFVSCLKVLGNNAFIKDFRPRGAHDQSGHLDVSSSNNNFFTAC